MGVMNTRQDPYNKLGLRNSKNTDNYFYNCGGYALNIYSWYCPMRESKDCSYGFYGDFYNADFDSDYFNVDYDDFYNSTYQELLEKQTELCVKDMLKTFKGELRVIKDIKELKRNEYAFAFRISGEVDDFHFCKRSKRGHWTHKMGNGYIQKILKKDVFAPYWVNSFGEHYEGKIVLFAKKD